MLLPLLSRCHFQTSMKTYVDIMHSISSQASKIFLISRLHSHTHTYIDLLWKFIASSITIGRRDESWQHENIFYIIIAQLSTITLWKFVISINKWWKMLPRCTLSFSSPCSAPRWWMRILFYYYFSHFKASGWCLLMIHL